jgi:hypothetical protein
LFVWWPVSFAVELGQTLPSLEMRGPLGVIELLAHAAVAAVAIAAISAIWQATPAGPTLAAAALIASAAASIQSFYWSVLPHQTKPGDELPLSILAILHTAAWLAYLSRSRRVREMVR